MQSRRGIVAAIATISIVGIGLSLQFPLLAFALEERGLTRSLIGLNTTVAGIATILITPVTPTLVRRFGVAPVLSAGVVITAATLALFPFTEPVWLWFPLRFVNGAALAILFVTGEFWINAVADDRRRGLIMGIYATILSLGFAAGPTLLSLTGVEGAAPFLVGAALILVGLLPIALGGGEAPVVDKPPPGRLWTYVAIAPTAMLASFFFGAVESSAMSFLPLFGVQAGYDEEYAALLVTSVAIGNVLFQIPVGLLADRVDRRLLLLGCGLTGLAGAILLPFVASHFRLTAALLIPWGGVTAGLYTVGLTHLGSRFTGGALASANAAFVVLYSLGMLVGPATTGVAMDLLPVTGLPLTLGVLFLLFSCVAAVRLGGSSRTSLT